MKKKYLALLLCASMTGALVAGCGNEESKKDDTTKQGGETKGTEAATVDKDKAEDAIKNLIANTEGIYGVQK